LLNEYYGTIGVLCRSGENRRHASIPSSEVVLFFPERSKLTVAEVTDHLQNASTVHTAGCNSLNRGPLICWTKATLTQKSQLKSLRTYSRQYHIHLIAGELSPAIVISRSICSYYALASENQQDTPLFAGYSATAPESTIVAGSDCEQTIMFQLE
jgi:hypothetical protein